MQQEEISARGKSQFLIIPQFYTVLTSFNMAASHFISYYCEKQSSYSKTGNFSEKILTLKSLLISFQCALLSENPKESHFEKMNQGQLKKIIIKNLRFFYYNDHIREL